MGKSRPNWVLWKQMREVNVVQAVALTLNVEPRLISASRRNASDFADRLFLFENWFGTHHKISLLELAKWAQSREWNIPAELGELAPLPAVEYEAAPDHEIDLAIASILAPGANAANLRNALESEGWRFVISNGTAAIHIRDGTVKGQLQSFENIYSAAGDLYHRTGNADIGGLMRGSGASGGGARQSNVVHSPVNQVSSSVEAASVALLEAPAAAVQTTPSVDVAQSRKANPRNKWDENRLRHLYSESILPGATQETLAVQYGISRQAIAKQIKAAKKLCGVGRRPNAASLAWKGGK